MKHTIVIYFLCRVSLPDDQAVNVLSFSCLWKHHFVCEQLFLFRKMNVMYVLTVVLLLDIDSFLQASDSHCDPGDK